VYYAIAADPLTSCRLRTRLQILLQLPVPIFTKFPDTDEGKFTSFKSPSTSDDEEEDKLHNKWDSDRLLLYSQTELNNLIRG